MKSKYLVAALVLSGFGAQGCALLGTNEKAYVNGVLAKREHRYVVAKEYFDQVDPTNKVAPVAKEEAESIEGIIAELRRAQRDAEISYGQQRWVAAFVNYQIVAKYQPWNSEAQARLKELQEKTAMQEFKPAPKPEERKATVVARAKPAEPAVKTPTGSKSTATQAKAAPVEPVAPAVADVSDGKKDEIDEKLRVVRQLERAAQHQQIVDLMVSVVDVDYRRDDTVGVYVPALLELAQKAYTGTDYGKAAKLFKEAYRVKPDPSIGKLLERTEKLASALAGG